VAIPRHDVERRPERLLRDRAPIAVGGDWALDRAFEQEAIDRRLATQKESVR